MTRLVSPNDMLAGAKQHMLEGRDPVTENDWALVMNFVLFNTAFDDAATLTSVGKLFKAMYQIPLDDEYIGDIAKFMAEKKEAEK